MPSGRSTKSEPRKKPKGTLVGKDAGYAVEQFHARDNVRVHGFDTFPTAELHDNQLRHARGKQGACTPRPQTVCAVTSRVQALPSGTTLHGRENCRVGEVGPIWGDEQQVLRTAGRENQPAQKASHDAKRGTGDYVCRACPGRKPGRQICSHV